MIKWFDDDGAIRLTRDGAHPVENTMLYHCTYLMLKRDYSKESAQFVADRWLQNIIDNDPSSHDNMTGVLTYLSLCGDKDSLELVTPFKYPHPRDFLYILYVKHPLAFSLCALILAGLPYFIFLGIFLYMALRKYKYRTINGVKVKILKTDTEILYWIRTMLPKKYFLIHATRPIIEPILRWRFGPDWVYRMMKIYYKDDQHPNVVLSKMQKYISL
jgi:hypothetical protein